MKFANTLVSKIFCYNELYLSPPKYNGPPFGNAKGTMEDKWALLCIGSNPDINTNPFHTIFHTFLMALATAVA